MGVKWTPEQESAIIAPKDSSLDNQTLLVAAAAGSGKTAVLVERIITRLKDMDNPLSVQELMVVTFTKAAAQEMSARIGLALAKAMESTDDAVLQERLERQLNLLPSAHISTLHSFCQWVIRSYFYKLDINPTARIGNEAEMALLQQEVLADLLTKSYEEGLYNIYELADFFSDDKSDAGLTAKIMSLYNYAMSLANPDGWLRKALEPYKEAMTINPSDTLWGEYMWSNHMAVIDRIRERLERMEQILLDPTGPHKWQNIYDNQLAALGMLSAAQTWDDMGEACKHMDTFIKDQFRMGSKEAQAYDPILVAEFKSLGGQNKDDLKAMETAIFTVPEAALQEHRIDLGLVEGIFRLPNLKYTPFLQDELVAVVHTQSKLAVSDEITPEDLLNIPLVLRERGSGTLDVFERALLQHNLKLSSLNVLMYLGSTESIKLFLEHTDCMGIVSIRSVHKELVAGNLRVVEIKGMPMLREFNFVQLQGQEGGLSQVFMRFAGHHSKSL